MGQSLNKSGSEEKEKEIEPVILNHYDKYFSNTKDWNYADFYHAVCQIVEEINRTIGRPQFKVQEKSKLQQTYNKHRGGEGTPLKKEQFQKILKEVILDTGVTNIGGAKDMFFYLYGVPAAALFLKQRLAPKLIPNEVLIPVVTSATVFLLAKLNKL
ncbi:uncharacterized protein LOC125188056 [Salvia hispanica]|uniref:Uncharacterized protein n=1 Tax=Salvia splendens TaxID=180675 RepID=A0A8X8XDY8_SALSN|nr:uncharacterized protein LOC121747765 isoform X1 [Salvia splendens]XP_042003081.1 uncharacterized protein LOC121752205 isoform X1 [Salvia splendens]XP_047940754.1 uncharacterized protein LOC125188056 [Salvia hispanica]KAG6411079.1 hypothetical protein SASPL_129153 [Salvia splendens]